MPRSRRNAPRCSAGEVMWARGRAKVHLATCSILPPMLLTYVNRSALPNPTRASFGLPRGASFLSAWFKALL
jgi:hypothetical protein